MTDLHIILENFVPPEEVLTAFRWRLTSGGMSAGTIHLSALQRDSDTAFIQWTHQAERPVSITCPKSDLGEVRSARAVGEALLTQWRQRAT